MSLPPAKADQIQTTTGKHSKTNETQKNTTFFVGGGGTYSFFCIYRDFILIVE